MAEAITVVTPVIDMLVQLLIKEANLFKGVHGEVKSLKDELESIQCFLKDAEEKSEMGYTNDGVKTWVKQVREEAFHIEDVIDEYLLHVAQRRHRHGFMGLRQKTGHLFEALKPRRDIAFEIEKIKASLHEIKDRGERYGFNSMVQGSSSIITNVENHNIRLGSLFLESDAFLDVHCVHDELIAWLVEGASTRTNISLVGSGGIGKTTLAKKIYDVEVVKKHFDCCAWINVSQSYNLEKILKKMAKQLCPAIEHTIWKIDMIEDLIALLRQFLDTKRYVIVFDDVWQIDFLRIVKHALPNNNKGSRVIVTTRNDLVATSCKDNSYDLVKTLSPLSQEMAWKLFCRKAFPVESNECCPQELEQLSLNIVRKCQGLPLVISSVAGLLSTKEKSAFEWQMLYDALNSELETNPHLSSISKILSLSYNNLPYYLKPCFLYFGIFPEDRLILETTLYRYWIAEGFVKDKRGKTLEQVAAEYLNELIQRNLVQVRGFYCGGKLHQVHDLMRDIILSRVDELAFCQILDAKKTSFRGNCRRLSIHGSAKSFRNAAEVHGVRSIFLFNIDDRLTRLFMVNCFEKLKFLKVLNLVDVPLDCLPKEVGNMFNLKYLSLRNTKVKMLPKSIGKLQNLQVLDIINTSVRELPIEINKLRNLRHIFVLHHDPTIEHCLSEFKGVRIQKGIGCLEELQTLIYVEVHDSYGFIKELEMLRQLRFLGLLKLTAKLGTTLCSSIEKMNQLQKLSLVSNSENEILDLQTMSSPPPLLRDLILMGQLLKLPDWIMKSSNLRRLGLYFSRLSNDPLKCLQILPSLEYVHLESAYDGEEVHIEECGYKKLKLLRLCNLNRLKVMKIDTGALPLLEELWIGSCPLLTKAPSNIQHLKNLKLVEISEMPSEFVLDMQPIGDQHCWKIKHVTSINSWYEHEGNMFANIL